jgi:hypothetical protein
MGAGCKKAASMEHGAGRMGQGVRAGTRKGQGAKRRTTGQKSEVGGQQGQKPQGVGSKGQKAKERKTAVIVERDRVRHRTASQHPSFPVSPQLW